MGKLVINFFDEYLVWNFLKGLEVRYSLIGILLDFDTLIVGYFNRVRCY